MDERDEKIWKMRCERATYSQIAKQFDLSSGRIRQICSKKQRRIERSGRCPSLRRELPMRIQNVLVKTFGSEEILNHPEKLASMGHDAFLTWKNLGRKSARELVYVLESLGYTVDSGTMMIDPRSQPFLKMGRTILRNYFDYYTRKSLDDTEYIPVVRLIIEGIAQEMKSSGLLEPNYKEVAEKLNAFNLALYQNLCIEHAKEDHDPGEGPFGLREEYELAKSAKYTFEYIYKHGEHPR